MAGPGAPVPAWRFLRTLALVLAVAAVAGTVRAQGVPAADPGARYRALLDSADARGRRQEVPAALATYDSALALAREHGKPATQVLPLAGVAALLARTGRLDSALVLLRRARDASLDDDDHGMLLLAPRLLSALFQRLGRPDSAFRYAQEAAYWSTSPRLGDRDRGAALADLAEVERLLGRADSALAHGRRAAAFLEAVHDSAGAVGAWLTVASTWFPLAMQPDSSLTALRHARALRRTRRDAVRDELLMASGWMVLGRLDSALAISRRVLAEAVDSGDTTTAIGALQVLGSTFQLVAPDSARSYLGRAVALAIAKGGTDLEADALGRLAVLELRDPPRAESLAIRAIALTEGRPAAERIGAMEMLAVARLLQGDYTGGRAAVGALLDSIPREYGGLAAMLEGLRGVSYLLEGSVDSAVRSLGKATAPGGVAAQGSGIFLRLLARALASAGRTDSALAVYQGAADAVEESAGSAPSDALLLAAFGLFTDVYAEWATLAAKPGDRDAALRALYAIERGRAQALRRLRLGRAIAATPREDPVRSISDLLDRLPHRHVGYLTYAVADSSGVIWSFGPDGTWAVAPLRISRDSLARLVAGVRAGLQVARPDTLAGRGAPGTTLALARGGFDDLPDADLAPVDPAALAAVLLPDHVLAALEGAREVVIVPAGPLALVPFAALPVHGAPWGAQVAIRYGPSLRILADLAAGRAPDRATIGREALVVGDPVMPRGFHPLAGARAEASWVAGRLTGKPAAALLGPQATEGAVRARLPKASIVHLATHGVAFADTALARASFLVLGKDGANDGELRVADLMDDPALGLKAELVVLSACQTGIGAIREGEGTVGLQRAFLARGARSLLVSLWNVDDAATAALVRGFYTHWLGDRDRPTKAEALRRAQEEVRRVPKWTAPKYWAAFQVVGAE